MNPKPNLIYKEKMNMNNTLNLQMELLEDVSAPGNARDFVEGVAAGVVIAGGVVAVIALT